MGHYFEDFTVGQVFHHEGGRTITKTDNIWFTLLTMNQNPIHLDANHAAKTEFKKPLVNSTLTLALVTGLSVEDLSKNAVNLGWDEIRLPNPLFEEETLYARSEILEVRPSKSRPNMGIVRFRTTGYKEDGTEVITFLRTILVYRRP